MTPHDTSQKENEEEVRIKLPGKSMARAPKVKFRIGEQVRIAKLKRHFEKGNSPNWTEEVFVVDQVLPTRPVTYKIRDLAEPIVGNFNLRTANAENYPDHVPHRESAEEKEGAGSGEIKRIS